MFTVLRSCWEWRQDKNELWLYFNSQTKDMPDDTKAQQSAASTILSGAIPYQSTMPKMVDMLILQGLHCIRKTDSEFFNIILLYDTLSTWMWAMVLILQISKFTFEENKPHFPVLDMAVWVIAIICTNISKQDTFKVGQREMHVYWVNSWYLINNDHKSSAWIQPKAKTQRGLLTPTQT